MPDAPGLELIRGEIERDRPEAVLDTSFAHDRATLIVDPAQVIPVLAWLRDEPAHRYTFLSSLHVADYLPASPRFGVHYELLNRDRVERLRVKAMLGDPAGADEPASKENPASRPEAQGHPGVDRQAPSAGGEGEGPRTDQLDRPQDPPLRQDPRSELPSIDSCVGLFPTADFQEREAFDFFGIVFRGHPDLTRILMPDDYVGWPQRRDFPVGGEPVTFTYNERRYG